MLKNKYVIFLICAICAKFIFNFLLITGICALILGAWKMHNTPLKVIIFGLIMGFESACLYAFFSASNGLSIFLGIFRSMGFSIADGFSYATVSVTSFAYTILLELIFVVLMVKIAEWGVGYLQKKGLAEFLK